MTKKKILLVHDDPNTARELQSVLLEKGFDIKLAYDGLLGMKLFESDEFNLVVLDMNQREVDGCELCKWIRQLNEQIPIIMLTTTDSIQDRINGYQAGADAFFILPNEVNELVGKIERTHSHTPCPPKGKT